VRRCGCGCLRMGKRRRFLRNAEVAPPLSSLPWVLLISLARLSRRLPSLPHPLLWFRRPRHESAKSRKRNREHKQHTHTHTRQEKKRHTMTSAHVDASASPAEFTQLRKPDVAAKSYWGTSIFQGIPITFRVLDDAAMTPVDSTAYLNTRLQNMHQEVQNASIHRAAELAYRSVLVEVSILDDPLALPSAADSVTDLWLPLHVALMTGNKSAVQTLLQFHVDHAVEAITYFANTPSTVCTVEEEEAAGARHMASTDSPVLASLGSNEENEDTVRGSIGDAARLAQDQPVSSAAVAAPTVLTAGDPILDCQVRRELGGTVVLLGHFHGRVRHSPSSSAAVRKSRAPSPVRSVGGSVATPLPAFTAIPISRATGTSNYNNDGTNSAAPLPGSTEDLLLQSVAKYNDELLMEENALFEDKGEVYCLMNVLKALRPLLQSVVMEIERRWQAALPGSKTSVAAASRRALSAVPENAIGVLRDFCTSLTGLPQHPPLLVEANVLFELCHNGDLALLTKVMDIFEGTLAPVLRGQALLIDRQHGAGGAGVEVASTAGVPVSMLHAATASRDPSPHLSSLNSAPLPPPAPLSISVVNAGNTSPAHHSLSRDQSGHSVTGTPRGSSLGRHLHPPVPISFWWSCRPQQVHQLAFTALWIGCREAVEESSASGRRRRAVSISTENRVMMATIRQLVESRVAAQKLGSMIWSGHLVTITKLLSRDCTLEDFMDFVEEGGYFNVASPCGFSGPFLSVLVSGVVAAAAVRDAATMRVLRRKVETLLADVPGRPSPLRAYVMGRPLTHAERFRELWLDAGSYRADEANGQTTNNNGGDAAAVFSTSGATAVGTANTPHKFRTRVELLYYAVVEQVLEAAEEAWTQEPEDAQSRADGAAPTSLWVSGSTKQEAQAALQSWLLMWTNFFMGLRDRPDSNHRRSLSHSNASSQAAAKDTPQLSCSMDGTLMRERNTPRTQPAAAPMPTPSGAPEGGGVGSAEDLLSEDANEVVETVRRVCRALVDRLETGEAPLPALRRALFPNGVNDVDSGVSGAATPAQVDNALPMSSIDQEFTSAARAFGDMAAKESQEVQLKFYGLYKQATKGDVNTTRPGFFDYAGKAKWDAWSKLKGMSTLDAKRAYVSEYKMMVDLRKSKK
jgi:acyl-CoA-binding protein